MNDRIRPDQKPATAARIYDFYIGGTHNFPADREAAEQIIAMAPRTPAIARVNRAFLRRTVRYLTRAGIRQFIDIGSGIPTEGNVHEIAQRVARNAHVVYVDIDPVAVSESLEILEHNDFATAIRGDLRDPAAILRHPEVKRQIDFSRPVAVLLCAVLHFMTDDAATLAVIDTLRRTLTPGSYLVISHATVDRALERTNTPVEEEQAVQAVYAKQTMMPFRLRSRDEVQEYFAGFDLVDPGLVWLPQWRPDPADPVDFQDTPPLSSGWGAVGRRVQDS